MQVNTVAGVTGTHKFNCTPPKIGFCTKKLSATSKERFEILNSFHLYTRMGAWTRIYWIDRGQLHSQTD